jgi:hypothetical protein
MAHGERGIPADSSSKAVAANAKFNHNDHPSALPERLPLSPKICCGEHATFISTEYFLNLSNRRAKKT